MKKALICWGILVALLAWLVFRVTVTGAYKVCEFWESIPQAEKYTHEEKEMLLRIATAEGESEGVDGMYHVLEVVLNRVESVNYPDTIKEVVFQSTPCVQFESTANGRYENCEITQDAKRAYDLLNTVGVTDDRIIAYEGVGNDVLSKWYEYLYSLGHHRFYCEKGGANG